MPFPRRQRKPRSMPMHGALTNRKIAPSNELSRRRSMMRICLTWNDAIGFPRLWGCMRYRLSPFTNYVDADMPHPERDDRIFSARRCGSRSRRSGSAACMLGHPAVRAAMCLRRYACSGISLGRRADVGACRSLTTPTQLEVSNGTGAAVLVWERPLQRSTRTGSLGDAPTGTGDAGLAAYWRGMLAAAGSSGAADCASVPHRLPAARTSSLGVPRTRIVSIRPAWPRRSRSR